MKSFTPASVFLVFKPRPRILLGVLLAFTFVLSTATVRNGSACADEPKDDSRQVDSDDDTVLQTEGGCEFSPDAMPELRGACSSLQASTKE